MTNFKFFRSNESLDLFTYDLVLPPGINLNMHTVQVEGGARRLRATWTPEMAQDIETYQGIDVVSELEQLLANEISLAIDSEIMRNILGIDKLTLFKFFRG